MKRNLTIILQVLVVVLGLAALAFLLWEPHIEGRNAGATLFEIYFQDLFLACVYIASIPLFVGFYQAFKVLGYARQNKLRSHVATQALRTIKYCAQTIVGFAVGAEAYLMIVRPEDDIAGGVFMGLLIIAGSGIVAIVAKRLEQKLTKSL